MKFTRHPLSLALSFAVLCHGSNAFADTLADTNAATAPDASAASSAAPADAATATSELDTISVVSEGSTRQVQTVGREEIKKAALGTSPLKVLDKLPGVYFESADAWGTYEWSQRITFRGFNRQQLGYTLDDIPLGNGAYSTDNGLSVNRAILAENIRSIEIAQGGGALGMPSSNNLGGTIAVHTDDPNKDAGVRISQGFGSNDAWRSFIRADTGEINGFSAYLAGASTKSEKWRGDGAQDQSMLNAKVVYQWGGNKISAFFDLANRDETDFQDLSLDLIKRDGYRFDNFQPNWAAAVQAANFYINHIGTAPIGTTSVDDAYYSARGIRHDNLIGVKGEFALSDNISLRTTLYNHTDKGQGHWFTPYKASPDGTPISLRVSDYRLERNGAVAALNFDFGAHAIEAGFWYEQANNNDTRGYIALSGPLDDTHFYTNFFATQFQQRFSTETKQAYIQDTWTLLNDTLKINYGFKAQNIQTDGVSLIPNTRGSGSLKAEDNFLPQIGASYKFAEHEDVFANYTRNQSAFTPGLAGPWSAGAAAFTAAQSTLKPEQSTSFEAGVRSTHETYQASATVYNAEFSNRLLLISPCPGIQSCPTQFANVGKVRNQGVELALLWKPIQSLSWLNSFAYNDSKYRSNYFNGELVQIAGKQVVDAPKKLFSSSLDYRFLDGFSANLSAKYTDKRYYTYLNDQTIPSYWMFDAALSYERTDLSWSKDMRISLGVSNLANKNYIATVGTNGFAKDDPTGTFATLLSGAPRQVFASLDLRW